MNPSSGTSYHAETSNRPLQDLETNQPQSSTVDSTLSSTQASRWDEEERLRALSHALFSHAQPTSSTQRSSSFTGNVSSTHDPPPSWKPTHASGEDHPHRTGARPSNTTTDDRTVEENDQWFDLLFNYPVDQAGFDANTTHIESTTSAESRPDCPSRPLPDPVHSAASSTSTRSSTQSSDLSSEVHQAFQQHSTRPLTFTPNHMPSLSGYPAAQVGWQPQRPYVWPTQEQSSNAAFYQDPGTSSAQRPRFQEPFNTQRNPIANPYRISQPEAPQTRPTINTAPSLANRALHQPTVESPMISPLTISTSGTFQRHQADAMSRMASALLPGPTVARTRRRSAIYYRHGRKVADTTIEVYEDIPETPAPNAGTRIRTTSCDSSLQTRKHLGDVTNRSNTVTGPISRAQIRKQSGPTSSGSSQLHALVELPNQMSNLAWVNNGAGPSGTGETRQQRDALDMLGKLREGAQSESRAQSSSHTLSQKGPARSR